jgi:hypothetical protein
MSRQPSLAATGVFFRRQLWVWPLLAALLLGLLAWWLRGSVESTLRRTLADQLETVLNADVAALDLWFKSEQSNVMGIAGDPEVDTLVGQIVREAQGVPDDELRVRLAEPIRQLRGQMQAQLKAHGYLGFSVIDRQERLLVSSYDELIGEKMPRPYQSVYGAALDGRAAVSKPFPSTVALPDGHGHVRPGVPTMVAGAPVYDEHEAVIAVLAVRIPPEVDFTRILSVARMGKTGETYACDADGQLLSESRFDDQLKDAGLLPDREDVKSIFNVKLRDPLVDLTRGERSPLARSQQQPNAPAQDAAAGRSGSNLDGYRDYRGVPSIGAWVWLPERGFAVVTEMDLAEALHPMANVRWAVRALLGLLVLASIAIFVYSLAVERLQRKALRAALEIKRLGQYVLDEKIGAGAMGQVYRAHHAMLRRPTAVKLIDPEQTNDTSIARFEREVQLTSQLRHPNTIAIYDYGRTPEGVFYYAMELLDGLTLQLLVERFGPQPEGRVVNVLKQVCGSLIEAHGSGLIHRDIKPANIMLCAQGGLFDFVKLLDFGLVKAVDGREQAEATVQGGLTGTPLYMAPEVIDRADEIDRRSDLYAVGAVGYFLVTGTPLFAGRTIWEICRHHLDTPVEQPTVRLGKPVSGDLEAVLLSCLAKSPIDRPADAGELLARLEACRVSTPWTPAEAADWWAKYRGTQALESTHVAVEPGDHLKTVDFSRTAS